MARVEPDGHYIIISTGIADWKFSGESGQAPTAITVQKGRDNIAAYQEIVFGYDLDGPKQASIRVYSGKPIVLFSIKYLYSAKNRAVFPKFAGYPQTPYHLSYNGQFGKFRFDEFGADSPWVFFDDAKNTFIISPASNFLIAATNRSASHEISSGIDARIPTLPEGFTHRTILVLDKGINRTFETWGRALTAIESKTRTPNDAEPILSKLGYWSDNGATYYYKFDASLGYEGTLLAIRDEFLKKGVPLGYLQLDSWFYPKGAKAEWKKFDGINEYVADKNLFPDGLKAFQQHLGLPLVTHARWIDPESPYRQKYQMSGNVILDPRYWETVANYLRGANVVTYEQDWLDERAQAAFNLNDPAAFMDEMAQAMKKQGLTIQYCMPLPRHYLQSTKYQNVTTIRTSGDRFGRDKWDEFLYDSRLASAVGLWPWSDVFMSSELENLLLSTLSAGPVGVGDAIGSVNPENLLRVARGDAVIVKPDAPIVPTDQTFIDEARGLKHPMLASTFTDFGSTKAFYVFAYARDEDQKVAFKPTSLGLETRTFVYNYFSGQGRFLNPDEMFTDSVVNGYAYFIVVPLGRSGIAFLGDRDQLVSLGKQRISKLTDNGKLWATISFAAGEQARTLQGYSPTAPVVTSIRGKASAAAFDSTTHLFTVSVVPDATGVAEVKMWPSQPKRSAKKVCSSLL